MSSEEPAKGKRGFLLYCPFKKKQVFRIYESEDKEQFTDYEICADDIEIEILDEFTTLYKTGNKVRIDYNRKVLGKPPLEESVVIEKSHCAKCNRKIDFAHSGDSYCGCWCGRWWCCEEHAKQDGWVVVGDAYDTDLVDCNHCRKKQKE